MHSEDHLAPDPWKFSSLVFDEAGNETSLYSVQDLVSLDFGPLPKEESSQQALKLPDLETFTYGALDDIASFEDSQSSDVVRGEDDTEVEEEDVWASASFALSDTPNQKARTWEQFWNKDFEEKKIYLSGATPEVWNAAWTDIYNGIFLKELKNQSTLVTAFPNDLVLKGLFDLGLGLSSALFTFSDGKARSRFDDVCASGLSADLTSDLIQSFGEAGLHFRRIAQYVSEVSRDSLVCPSVVAAAAVVGRIATSIKKEIVSGSVWPVTILQLKDIFQRPKLVLKRLASFTADIRSLRKDVEVINFVYRFAEGFESVDPWFRPIALKLLLSVANPWLKTLGQQIGLSGAGSRDIDSRAILAGLSKAREASIDAHAPSTEVLPEFLDFEQKEMLINTAKSLELLKVHSKQDFQFCNTANSSAEAPALEMAFTWEDIQRIQRKATVYETNMKRLKQNMDITVSYKSTSSEEKLAPMTNSFWDMEETVIEESFFRKYHIFANVPEDESSDRQDLDIADIIQSAHDLPRLNGSQSESLPPIAISSLASIDAVLPTQARLVNFAILKTLFQGYDAVHHFEVQRTFQLLGSGVFLSRLSQALYSQDLSSAERQKGHTRSGNMGLRLGSRKTWPPASAELRLVLRDILSECYEEMFSYKLQGRRSDDLPGDLSFSVRRLSEPEIQACLNSDSLQALDFLRLQYSPPPILNQVITDTSLENYDRIFRFLMRVMRVSVAITESSRFDSTSRVKLSHTKVENARTRLRIEAQHFMNSLLLYINTSISSLWNRFFCIIESLSHCILTDQVDQLSHSDGLFQLRQLHEAMLNDMLFELLLRTRQQRVMDVLEDILGLILEFTQVYNSWDDEGGEDRSASRLYDIHRELWAKQKLFISVCKDLSEKSAHRVARVLDSTMFAREWHAGGTLGGGIEKLVMMLDMNGYYEESK